MRIAMLSRAPPTRCGVAEYSSMLIEALRSAGVDAFFIANREDKPETYTRDPYSGAPAKPCFVSGRPGFSGDVLECVRELDPDIVHIQHEYGIFPSNIEMLSMLRELRRLGTKIVITMHSVAHALYGSEYVEFHRRLQDLVDAIVVHSPIQHTELLFQGVRARKLRVIPHGTLINPFTKILDREKALRKLGIDLDPSRPIMTTPGFVRADKGLDTLVKTFKIVRRSYDVQLLLMGEEQDESGVLSFVEKTLSDEDRGSYALMKGFLPRESMLAMLSAVDIVVLPYRDRNVLSVSGTLHLAIGSRRSVICTETPRLVECYTHAPSLAVPEPEPEDLAKRIVAVLEGGDEVRRDLERLWRYGEETSWDRVAEKHRRLYVEVLER